MKSFFTVLVIILLFSCNNARKDNTANNINSYLHDIVPYTIDSLVNVVIEIPAGTNEKWEVNKETGQIAWEKVSPDSFRIVDYLLPYPANYGFVPQTLLPKTSGGDGDPVDVFVLGSSISRESVVKVRIVGIIHLLDNNESDAKLLAVNTEEKGFDVNSLEMINNTYPGVIDIIKLWLLNYKGSGKINILSVVDEEDAIRYLQTAHIDYIDHKIY